LHYQLEMTRGRARIQTWEGQNKYQYNNLLLGGTKTKKCNKNYCKHKDT
jgi:hypothetical protein